MADKPNKREAPLLPFSGGIKSKEKPAKPLSGEDIMKMIIERAQKNATNPEIPEVVSKTEQALTILFEGRPEHFNFGKNDEKTDELRGGSMDYSPLIENITPLTKDDEGPAIIQLKNKPGRLYFTSGTVGIKPLHLMKESYNYNSDKFPPETPIPEKYRVTIEKIKELVDGTSIIELFPEVQPM